MLGGVLGEVLPEMISGALSVALYGMFIAIVIPEMKKSIRVTEIVLLAVALKLLFVYVPVLQKVSEGFAIILCAIGASLFGALVFPIKEDGQDGH